MNDIKNITLAWTSTLGTLLATVDSYQLISAIVLPVLLFAIGKTVDVFLQIYLNSKKEKQNDNTN